MPHAHHLIEAAIALSGNHKVDEEAGIIYGVKVLGYESAHGYSYTEAAVKDAIPLYEGVAVNIDHPKEPGDRRSSYDRFGKLVNPRLAKDGLYADLVYLKSHPLTARVIEAAKSPDKSNLFGLSHHAQGNQVKRDGKTVVEKIEAVNSVDLVADPATNSGLFESRKHRPMKRITVRKLLESIAKTTRQKRTLLEMEDAGLMPAEEKEKEGEEMAVELPEEEAPAQSPDEQASAAFKAMVMAVLDDASLDVAGKKKKIGDILSAQEKLMAAPEVAPEVPAIEGEGEEPAEEEKPVEESKRLAAENLTLKRTLKARELCEAHDVKPSASLLKALVVLDESDARALILESKSAAKASPARGQERRPAIVGDAYADFLRRLGREPAQV